MPTITRTEVQAALRNKEVDVNALKSATSVPAEVRTRMATADTNNDGVISGTAEVDKLFDAADHFDTNGTRTSVSNPNAVAGVQAAMNLARAPGTSAPSSILRSDLQAGLAGKQVSIVALRASNLPTDVKNRLSNGDINGDGVIKGPAEIDRLFDSADYFDNDGNRNSVTATNNGVATKAGAGLTTVLNLATSTLPPTTVTKDEVQEALTGREISVAELNSQSVLSTQVKQKLAAADINGDGVIRGTIEVDKLFAGADFFDSNGNRESVAGARNGEATTAGRALMTALNISRVHVVPPVTLDDNFRIFRTVDTAALKTLLPTEAKHLAREFVNSGVANGVDPLLLMSISKHETANWTSSAFRTKNNAMGISDANGPKTLPSHAAGILQMAQLIGSTTSGPYRTANTYRELWAIYAPGPATGQPRQSNDPNNLNANWGPAIVRTINDYSAAVA
ncbi:MAG TPA: hypothetical protein VGF99_08845 [Myxococcota bacterium]